MDPVFRPRASAGPWGGVTSEHGLPDPEQIEVSIRYVVQSARGPGREAACDHAAVNDPKGQPIYLMTLTARGRPLSNGTEGALASWTLRTNG